MNNTENLVQLHDLRFKEFISEGEIQLRITELADQITQDYQGKKPLFIGILNGCFMFAADLFRQINTQAEISFLRLSSYSGMKSTGEVRQLIGLPESVHGRHIIIMEDIVDTGKTLSIFIPQLEKEGPESIKIASLLVKPEANEYGVKTDYVGFEIPNKFVVGYGLDHDGLGRNLRDIYQLVE